MIFSIFTTFTKTIPVSTYLARFWWLGNLCNPINLGYHMKGKKVIFMTLDNIYMAKNNENFRKMIKIASKSSGT